MKCKSCGAKILWITTSNGRGMPVNADSLIPVRPGGTKSACVVTPDGNVVLGDPTWRGHPEAVLGYVSHFATCPDAEKWRKDNAENKNVR